MSRPPTRGQGAGEAAGGAPAALERAQALLDANRPELARREIVGALARTPEDPALHAFLGQVLRATSGWAEAEQAFRRSLELDPAQPGVLCSLGMVEMEQGRHPQAEASLLESLRMAPQWAPAYLAYATLMFRTGHLDKAQQLLERCLALDPESDGAHQLLALLHAEEQRAQPAAAHARQGLAASPDSSFSHASQAVALLHAGHPFQARRALREALRIEPDDKDLEAAYLEADRCCRLVYLPMYHWSRLIERVPGGPFTLWGAFGLFVLVARAQKWNSLAVGILALAYGLLCVYTWVAGPLVSLWVRMVPPR